MGFGGHYRAMVGRQHMATVNVAHSCRYRRFGAGDPDRHSSVDRSGAGKRH